MRRLVAAACVLAGLGGLSACEPTAKETPDRDSPAAVASAAVASEALLRAVREAEYDRAASGIPDAALSSRDPSVRRAAARALARIGGNAAADRLLSELSDEDGEVVAWAAYGIGLSCRGREAAAVRALAVRAASLVARDQTERSPTLRRFVLDPIAALADGLGRCGTPEAEQTLRGWLDRPPPWADAAGIALGRIAARRSQLDDSTIVRLLDAASRPEQPVHGALVPFSRLPKVSDSAARRLVEVATDAIAAGGRPRSLALGAIAPAGPLAVPLLGDVLTDAEASHAERSTAARQLGTLSDEGQRALRLALADLAAAPDRETLRAGLWAPLLSTLRALTPPVSGSADVLGALAALDLEGADPALRRRLVAIRCAAASLLAGTASLSVHLTQCDPDDGRVGALATLDVLDRGPLTGARARRFLELFGSEDVVVRRRAVELLAQHDELRGAPDVLAQALDSDAPGVVAAAARVLIARPERASREDAHRTEANAPLEPAPAVLKALGAAVDRKRDPDHIEPRGLLLRAAAAVGLLSVKPKAEAACRDGNPTLREHARAALRAFGQNAKECTAAPGTPPAGERPSSLPTAPRTLTFVTDAGRLGMTLDPELAPLSVARIVSLAQKGFYDGMAIHRVVPGFVVQLGDRNGDGYGGAGLPPLPSEAAPAAFEQLGVGLAQSGPDTGSSQIFVTLATEPLLGGDYPMVGWADPEWYGVAEGDVVRSVEVKE